MLNSLNAPQREAVKYLDGPLLVLAGAGSGKTRVITQKIAYLIEQCNYSPRHIAAITFTNKAAKEMQERVGKLLQGKPSKGLTICTFHALGMQILRHEAEHLGYKRQFSVLDTADSFKILGDTLATTDKQLIKKMQWQISAWKNALLGPADVVALANDEFSAAAVKAYRTYQQTLQSYQSVDFDDLIRLPVLLFEQQPTVLAKWQDKLRYLLIDEYQDTNACQYRLIRQLADSAGHFTAVGDDDQAIYGWRGADVENLRQLTIDFPQLNVIKLEQNYRSCVRILQAANKLIANNPKLFEKQIWSDLGMGDPIEVTAMRDEEHEAESVILKLQAHKFEHRANFKDYAILYRGNHQARLFEQHLRNHKIPYILSGGQSFFDKAEIKDLVSYLRLIANEDDDPAFIRAATTPRKGIGSTTIERLGEFARLHNISLFAAAFEAELQQSLGARQLEDLLNFCDWINALQSRAAKDPAGEVLQDMLKGIQYEAYLYDNEDPKPAEIKWQNVLDFIAWLSKKGESDIDNEGRNLLQLTQMVSLMSILEGREEGEVDAVKLSTLHAAKGLEYGHVFLVGCEEGILPHRESIDADKVEEERRLMYVGITRAQRSLHITWCRRRKRAGEVEHCEPSRFIGELPQNDIRHFGGENQDPTASKAYGQERLSQIRNMLKMDSKP